jgi:hypothetical protein
MTNKRIKDVIQKVKMFVRSFGPYPDVEEIKRSYRQNQEEIGEQIEEFEPNTPFEAFCELYFMENTPIIETIYKTTVIFHDMEESKRQKQFDEREAKMFQSLLDNQLLIKKHTLTASHK